MNLHDHLNQRNKRNRQSGILLAILMMLVPCIGLIILVVQN